jgi:hypothetical protein
MHGLSHDKPSAFVALTIADQLPLADRGNKEREMKLSQVGKYCYGCDNNFYNGNNPYNVQVCWSVKDAKIVFGKLLSIGQPDPSTYLETAKSVRRPNCYRPKRMLFIKEDSSQ